jgi:hypothetical protein
MAFIIKHNQLMAIDDYPTRPLVAYPKDQFIGPLLLTRQGGLMSYMDSWKVILSLF